MNRFVTAEFNGLFVYEVLLIFFSSVQIPQWSFSSIQGPITHFQQVLSIRKQQIQGGRWHDECWFTACGEFSLLLVVLGCGMCVLHCICSLFGEGQHRRVALGLVHNKHISNWNLYS